MEWTKEPPTEPGLYWWWDEDGDPIPVHLSIGRYTDKCFAEAIAYHSIPTSDVSRMGGWWKIVAEPDVPQLCSTKQRGE